LSGAARRGDPHGRLAAELDDLVGDPLELLAIAAVERQRDQPVEQLRDAEPLQLAPQRDPRRRWLTL